MKVDFAIMFAAAAFSAFALFLAPPVCAEN